jgi:predicted PurR-regulated permease PerM
MTPVQPASDRPLDGWASVRPWIMFGGCVMVVAVLHWARPVLMPLALATLLTFVLSPAVNVLQRIIGRVAAAIIVVSLVTGGLGLASWVAVRQVASLIEELPAYRTTIRNKIADVRGASSSGPVGRLQAAIDDIQNEITNEITGPKPTRPPTPVVVDPAPGPLGLPAWLWPLIDPLAAAGLVIVLVTFMLIERQELRNRLIRLIGHGDPARATRAFSEAGTRVLRQLRAQLLVNLIFGTVLGLALFLIGVPYALLWAGLGAALRFVPYIGPIFGAVGPVLVSLAVFPGWTATLWVSGVLIVLELFTNVVLETVLYAGTAGVSQAALLVGIAFWTWLWGPLGLLMATPLTVCLFVLGKHLRPLRFLGMLMADTPALSAESGFYQRLLAKDLKEAAHLVERHVKTESADTVYDALLIPALAHAERDVAAGRLSPDEHRAVLAAVGDLVDVATAARRAAVSGRKWFRPDPDDAAPAISTPAPDGEIVVLACAMSSEADAVALRMLDALVADSPVRLIVQSQQLLTSELLAAAESNPYDAVCLAELSASPSARMRHLVKRLHTAAPDRAILVGRWGPADPDDAQAGAHLREAGATHVGDSLIETADRLHEMTDRAGEDRESDAGPALRAAPRPA